MKRALRFLIPAVFILMLFAPGCYTVVMHPSNEQDFRASQTSDCTRCHGDYREYPYGYYYSPYPSYWWEHSNYSYYYAYPWWWSYYDYPYLDGDYTYDTPDQSRSKFDRRAPIEPAPPPHSVTSDGWDQRIEPIRPGLYDLPSDISTGDNPPAGTDTRSKDEGTAEENTGDSQQPRSPRPKPTTEQNVAPDNTQQNTEPAKDQTDQTGKKKSRRGGGGGR